MEDIQGHERQEGEHVGITSQSLSTRLSQHKAAARGFKNGVASRTKRRFPYTRAFYNDLTHGSWKIVLLEQVKGDHDKALRIERPHSYHPFQSRQCSDWPQVKPLD